MRITVLGSGAGGCAVAADWALAGHTVSIFDFEAFPENIRAIREQAGIRAEGGVEGFAPVRYAGHAIEEALEDTEVIIIVGPAFSTKPFAEIIKPHVRRGQTIIVSPGSSGGALELRKTLQSAMDCTALTIAETSTLPYACRITSPGSVKVFLKLKGGLYLSALPASQTEAALEVFKAVYPDTTPARNVFQTMLQNGNPIIHPAVTLSNLGLIERTAGDFFFYEDGVTPAVGRLIEGLDRERIRIGEQLDVTVLPDPELGVLQGYMKSEDYETGYRTAPGFMGIKAQSQLNHRYLNEDVGYGLVFMTELAALLGVETPLMNAVIEMASCAMARNYRAEGARTLDSLGLRTSTRSELMALIH